MATGKVKWFDPKKGYGFISVDPDKSGKVAPDLFVHYSDIKTAGGDFKSLSEGDQVSFNVSSGPKGDKALNVKLLRSVINDG